MIKKMPYGENLKEQLLANARDKLHRFLLLEGTVRGAIVHGTRMVNEMRANHELGILETLVLGHGYLAGALMCADLKGDERITLQIGCSGPIKGLLVEANAFGEVRGYLKNVPIPIEKPLEDFNLAPFFRRRNPLRNQGLQGGETTVYRSGGTPVRQHCQGPGILLSDFGAEPRRIQLECKV